MCNNFFFSTIMFVTVMYVFSTVMFVKKVIFVSNILMSFFFVKSIYSLPAVVY